ncbi:MAG: hypothetical protein Q4G27_10325 [Flavobacteriaceae bacterium]|nr:hypothetical protein [Flavobacteriaceae bacterium]
MKKYISIILIFITLSMVTAQVAIERATMTNNSSLFEFGDIRTTSTQKGVILPASAGTQVVEGTLWIDSSGVVWVQKAAGRFALTGTGQGVTIPTLPETGAGVVITHEPHNADNPAGVLELRSTSKTMILPHVHDVTQTMSNPHPGTWVYDSDKKAMAFFNGTQWEFNYGQ